jgi:hypothetical protein
MTIWYVMLMMAKPKSGDVDVSRKRKAIRV